MQKLAYALVRDQFGNPKFDDGTGKTPGKFGMKCRQMRRKAIAAS